MAHGNHHNNTHSLEIHDFDIDELATAYSKTLLKNDADEPVDIDIESFLFGYRQILNLFNALGRLFGFMASEVSGKISILYGLLEDAEKAAHYKLLSSMLVYEREKGLAPTKNKRIESGVRAYLRLHRGLAFVQELFSRLSKAKEDDHIGPIAKVSYDLTLAPYHAWIVKKGVAFALTTLPNTLQVAKNLKVTSHSSEKFPESDRNRLRLVAEECEMLHKYGERALGDAKCLDLP